MLQKLCVFVYEQTQKVLWWQFAGATSQFCISANTYRIDKRIGALYSARPHWSGANSPLFSQVVTFVVKNRRATLRWQFAGATSQFCISANTYRIDKRIGALYSARPHWSSPNSPLFSHVVTLGCGGMRRAVLERGVFLRATLTSNMSSAYAAGGLAGCRRILSAA